MRATMLTGPGQMAVEEHPRPEVGPRQLLVQAEACGLCASELDVFLGHNPWQHYPALLGHEGVGRVIAAGDEVTGWREGDRAAVVQAGGCYAEYFVVDADAALPVPPGLPPRLALAEPLACAVASVEEVAPRFDDRIVVLGAGFMGLALLQLVRGASPAWVLAVARREDARLLAGELGATETCAPSEVQSRVWALTGSSGADVVIEATGSEEMLAIAASLLRPEGTLAIVGYHQGHGRQVPVHEWNWKALRIANCHFRSRTRLVDSGRRGLALAARGAIDLRRLVTHQFPLSEVQRAFETAASRPAGYVKGVLVPDEAGS